MSGTAGVRIKHLEDEKKGQINARSKVTQKDLLRAHEEDRTSVRLQIKIRPRSDPLLIDSI